MDEKDKLFVCDLPAYIHHDLYAMFDKSDMWKKLALKMKFGKQDIKQIADEARNSKLNLSPTEILFREWSRYHHSVAELYTLLYYMKHLDGLHYLLRLAPRGSERLLQDVIQKTSREKPKSERPAANIYIPALPSIELEVLAEATNHWSQENLLGKGSYGFVYKGIWKESPVAVKRLQKSDLQDLARELIINAYRHLNIMYLYAYCISDKGQGRQGCLVYPLMKTSLDKALWIRGENRLLWPQRFKVALGVARGLQYMHTKKPDISLVHSDVKPANILLDRDYEPKIADFGLAREVKKKGERVKVALGTSPYMPEEYSEQGILSPAVDVFSFGVLMLELATGLPPVNKQSKKFLHQHIYTLIKTTTDADGCDHLEILEDPNLRNLDSGKNSNCDLCKEFIKIGLSCTRARLERPFMEEVYKDINKISFDGKLTNEL